MKNKPRIYRGIKLHDDMKLYSKENRMNPRIKMALDTLADLLEKNNDKLLSAYKNATTKILIEFHCGHEPQYITPFSYKKGNGCKKCARIRMENKLRENGKNSLLRLVRENNHILLTDYIDNKTKVVIDFKCGHEPHAITPENYKNGYGCPDCGIEKRYNYYNRKKREAGKEFEKAVIENGHMLLSKYTKMHDKVLINFNCGHEPHYLSPRNYIAGQDCPICTKERRR